MSKPTPTLRSESLLAAAPASSRPGPPHTPGCPERRCADHPERAGDRLPQSRPPVRRAFPTRPQPVYPDPGRPALAGPSGPHRTELKQDEAAVKAALSSVWSNGQVEGRINRLKTLKRQMYGRAGFDLLGRRFLQAG